MVHDQDPDSDVPSNPYEASGPAEEKEYRSRPARGARQLTPEEAAQLIPGLEQVASFVDFGGDSVQVEGLPGLEEQPTPEDSYSGTVSDLDIEDPVVVAAQRAADSINAAFEEAIEAGEVEEQPDYSAGQEDFLADDDWQSHGAQYAAEEPFSKASTGGRKRMLWLVGVGAALLTAGLAVVLPDNDTGELADKSSKPAGLATKETSPRKGTSPSKPVAERSSTTPVSGVTGPERVGEQEGDSGADFSLSQWLGQRFDSGDGESLPVRFEEPLTVFGEALRESGPTLDGDGSFGADPALAASSSTSAAAETSSASQPTGIDTGIAALVQADLDYQLAQLDATLYEIGNRLSDLNRPAGIEDSLSWAEPEELPGFDTAEASESEPLESNPLSMPVDETTLLAADDSLLSAEDSIGPDFVTREEAAPGMASEPATEDPYAGRAQRSGILPVAQQLSLPAPLEGLARATPADFTHIFPGDKVTAELLNSKRSLLTPAIGPVRVRLTNGEYFDGLLHQAGGHRLVLATIDGSLTLDMKRIEGVDHLDPSEPLVSSAGPKVGSELVRVRTKGGIITGRVLVKLPERLTMQLADGTELTLRDPQYLDSGVEANSVSLMGLRPPQ